MSKCNCSGVWLRKVKYHWRAFNDLDTYTFHSHLSHRHRLLCLGSRRRKVDINLRCFCLKIELKRALNCRDTQCGFVTTNLWICSHVVVGTEVTLYATVFGQEDEGTIGVAVGLITRRGHQEEICGQHSGTLLNLIVHFCILLQLPFCLGLDESFAGDKYPDSNGVSGNWYNRLKRTWASQPSWPTTLQQPSL